MIVGWEVSASYPLFPGWRSRMKASITNRRDEKLEEALLDLCKALVKTEEGRRLIIDMHRHWIDHLKEVMGILEEIIDDKGGNVV